MSPEELLIRTLVPVLADSLKPSWPDANLIREKDKRYKETYTQKYNKSHGVRDSEPFVPDQPVRFKTDKEKKWEKATVTQVHDKPRSYVVTTPDGRSFRRNAKHILPSSSLGPGAIAPDVPDDVPVPTEAIQPTPPTSVTTSGEASKQTFSPAQQKTTRSGRIIKPPKRLDL